MRRACLVVVLLGALSCKQACGLQELAPGSGGEGGTTASGGEGGAGGVTSGEGGGCVPIDEENVCETPFDTNMPTACLRWDACVEAPVACGFRNVAAGSLTMIPNENTGYWTAANEAMFLHDSSIPACASFVAYTKVRTHRTNNALMWPATSFALAGFVARDAACASAVDCGDWIKAEFGTLDQQGDNPIGLRVARHGTNLPLHDPPDSSPDYYRDDSRFSPDAPLQVQIALCRPDDGVVHAYYRPAIGGEWMHVAPTVNQPMPGALDVGIVAAVSSPPDLTAVFDELKIETGVALPDESACIPNLPTN